MAGAGSSGMRASSGQDQQWAWVPCTIHDLSHQVRAFPKCICSISALKTNCCCFTIPFFFSLPPTHLPSSHSIPFSLNLCDCHSTWLSITSVLDSYILLNIFSWIPACCQIFQLRSPISTLIATFFFFFLRNKTSAQIVFFFFFCCVWLVHFLPSWWEFSSKITFSF